MNFESRKTDQLENLRAAHDGVKAQLAAEKTKVQAIRGSFSFQLGNMLVQAVYKPGRNTILLPYRLIRLCVMEYRKQRKQADLYENRRFCPICENSSPQFLKFGVVPRGDAKCPHCGALERHRLFWLYVSRSTNLFDGKPKKMLHVAPEPALESKFKQLLGDNYLSADLFNPRAMVKMDITNIEYPAETFDVIYCSHVLEHVHDDRQAMRELYRVLKRNGWAILDVPITAGRTFEDPTITDSDERLRIFGQKDHVRRYGPDYVDRLREAGFAVKAIKVNDLLNHDEAVTMGLSGLKGALYYCTKQ